MKKFGPTTYRPKFIYLLFLLPPILSGFGVLELAVAATFGLTCFGFLASLLPRLRNGFTDCKGLSRFHFRWVGAFRSSCCKHYIGSIKVTQRINFCPF